jgi:hypothetical protein
MLLNYQNFFNGDDWTESGATERTAAPQDVCLNLLFTHSNHGRTAGSSFLGGGCAEHENFAVASTRAATGSIGTATAQKLVAHHIGHALNAEHDCSSDGRQCETLSADVGDVPDWHELQQSNEPCGDDTNPYLMRLGAVGGQRSSLFSDCSKNSINQWISSSGTCSRSANLGGVPFYSLDQNGDIEDVRNPSNNMMDPVKKTFLDVRSSRLGQDRDTLRDRNINAAITSSTPLLQYHLYSDDGESFVGEFDFLARMTPSILSITPNLGITDTRVTISGSLIGASTSTVRIGEHGCLNPEFETSADGGADTIKCTAPSLPGGKYHVSVLTAHGLAAHPVEHENEVTYVSQLLFTSVEPESGSIVGGTRITLAGHGFGEDASKVKVHIGQAEAVVKFIRDDQIILITPRPSNNVSKLTTADMTVGIRIELTANEIDDSANYGQLVTSMHSSLRTAPMANYIDSPVSSILQQAGGQMNQETQHLLLPEVYTTMSQECASAPANAGMNQCSFRYVRPRSPSFTNVLPKSGVRGDIITISGRGLKPFGTASMVKIRHTSPSVARRARWRT